MQMKVRSIFDNWYGWMSIAYDVRHWGGVVEFMFRQVVSAVTKSELNRKAPVCVTCERDGRKGPTAQQYVLI